MTLWLLVELLRWPSDKLPGGMGILQMVGETMGNDRKTERKTRNTLADLFFFFTEGCTRDTGWRGGGGGGGGGWESSSLSPAVAAAAA